MSDSVGKKKKKSKKSKKEVKNKTPSESESSDEELDLTKECHPIAHYIDDRPQMVAEMFSVIKGGKLKSMLPPILKDYDVEKLKLKCMDQLLGMSEKRILSILDGEILESSSESDVNSEDSEESEESQSEDQTSESSDNSRRKKKKTVKSESEESKVPEKKHNLWNPEDPNPNLPETQGKTLLEILELEMRARAIRALLKQNEVPAKSGPSQDQPEITAEVDLTEDDYPSVVKKENPSEQEIDFTEKLQKSAKSKKQNPAAKPLPKSVHETTSEQELRNRLIKKKMYRTRQQRLENIEPEVPPEPEKVDEPTNQPLSDPDIIPIEVVKKEPTEIILDDPEEGEVSSDEEEAPPVIIKQEKSEMGKETEDTQETSKEEGGERITAMDDGEFLSNTDVELPSTNQNEEEDNFIELVEDDQDLPVQSEGLTRPVDDVEQPQSKDDAEITGKPKAGAPLIEEHEVPGRSEQENGLSRPDDNSQSGQDKGLAKARETLEPEIASIDTEIIEIGSGSLKNTNQLSISLLAERQSACLTEDQSEIPQKPETEPLNLDDSDIIEIAKEPTKRRSKSELAEELKEIEEQIDRRTQQPLIVENVFPSGDGPVGDLSNVLVFKIGRKGQEMQQYVISSSAEPPVYDISDSEDFDDDDIMIIEDESATKELISTPDTGDLPEDSGTWRSRWLSKDKVQKIVKSSKICALVRKRLMSKKAALKAQKSTESEPAPEIPVPVPEEPEPAPPQPVIEGSVSEYERLFGKKVIETETIVQECLDELLDRLEREESAS